MARETFFLLYDIYSLSSLLATIANSDRRLGLEFDYNQEASLVRGARPLTDFNSSCT